MPKEGCNPASIIGYKKWRLVYPFEQNYLLFLFELKRFHISTLCRYHMHIKLAVEQDNVFRWVNVYKNNLLAILFDFSIVIHGNSCLPLLRRQRSYQFFKLFLKENWFPLSSSLLLILIWLAIKLWKSSQKLFVTTAYSYHLFNNLLIAFPLFNLWFSLYSALLFRILPTFRWFNLLLKRIFCLEALKMF